MIVEMRARITGTRDGVPWPAPGETLVVGDAEAADLVTAGLARIVGPSPDERARTVEQGRQATPERRRR